MLAGLISRHGESWPYRLGLLLGKRGAPRALGISLSRGRWAAVISSAHPEPLERWTRRPGWNRSCLLSELPSASKSMRELYPTSILSQRSFVQFPNPCFLKHRAHQTQTLVFSAQVNMWNCFPPFLPLERGAPKLTVLHEGPVVAASRAAAAGLRGDAGDPDLVQVLVRVEVRVRIQIRVRVPPAVPPARRLPGSAPTCTIPTTAAFRRPNSPGRCMACAEGRNA